MKKAIFFDLDNTIYPVQSIGDELFAGLFAMIAEEGNHTHHLQQIKEDIMRRPFQLVARDFSFAEALTQQGIAHLAQLTYNVPMNTFEDYHFTKDLPVDKFLVTTGFLKLQQSKIEALKIKPDFAEIHIVDPFTSSATKKDVFADIVKRHGYENTEILVVGDDPNSEIKAAQELGLEAILYDRSGSHDTLTNVPAVSSFKQLESFLF